MQKRSNNTDLWTGGTIDSLMFFGQCAVSDALSVASTLWSHPRLRGPDSDRTCALDGKAKFVAPDFTEDGCEQLVGTYLTTDDSLVPFIHKTLIDSDGLWVYAGIPVGGLPVSWEVGAYPFDDDVPLDWLLPLIDQLRDITAFVNSTHRVLVAVYGWLDVPALDIVTDALAGRIDSIRWHPIEVRDGSAMRYYPMTRIEPLFRFGG